MIDIAGVVLYNLLKNPESSVTIWPKLKPQFFNTEYSRLYSTISKYYNKYNSLPSFNSLKIKLRDEKIIQKINALELLIVPDDIDNLIAVEALADQYTQEETLNLLSSFIEKIPTYDTEEIKKELSNIVLNLEEKTNNSEEIVLMNDLLVIDEIEIFNKVPLGLNNSFDANTGGMALTELIMVGGYRKAGKTIVACNVAVNQYRQGKVSLFFSIEMRGREIFNRYISILSGVDSINIRKMSCNDNELQKIAKIRTDMFVDSEEVYQDYLKHKNYEKFELELIRSKKLKEDNQLITIDNQGLTMADMDMHISKYKAMYGDQLQVCVCDYLNAMKIKDMFDWKVQLSISNGFKELARKHNVLLFTPYQIDKAGEARFSKGILDKADVAMNISPNEEYLKIESTAVRNIKPFSFNAPIDWNTYEILPEDYIIPTDTGEEQPQDIVWN